MAMEGDIVRQVDTEAKLPSSAVIPGRSQLLYYLQTQPWSVELAETVILCLGFPFLCCRPVMLLQVEGWGASGI